jgi:hypothetical protein
MGIILRSDRVGSRNLCASPPGTGGFAQRALGRRRSVRVIAANADASSPWPMATNAWRAATTCAPSRPSC